MANGFVNIPASGGVTIGNTVSGGIVNLVLFVDGSGNIAQDVNFQWDGTSLNIDDQKEIHLFEDDANGSNYIALRAAASMVANYTITFPAAIPGTDTFLKYDGTNYIWAAGSAGLTIGDPITGGTANRILYENSSNDFDIAATLVFDGVNLSPTNPILFSAGTVSLPAMSFAVDPDTGFYRSAANEMSVAAGGTQQLAIADGLITSKKNVLVGDNSSFLGPGEGYMGFSFGTTLGMYLVAPDDTATGILFNNGGTSWGWQASTTADTVRFSTGVAAPGSGTNRAIFNTQGVQLQDGTAALPSYSFSADTDTGFLREGTGQIGARFDGATSHTAFFGKYNGTLGYAARVGAYFSSDSSEGTSIALRNNNGTAYAWSNTVTATGDASFIGLEQGTIGGVVTGEALRVVASSGNLKVSSFGTGILEFYRGTTLKADISGTNMNLRGANLTAFNATENIYNFLGGYFGTAGIVTGPVDPGAQTANYLYTSVKSDSGVNYAQFANSTTGSTATDGLLVGIDAAEKAWINQQENLALGIATNSTERITIAAGGDVSIVTGQLSIATAGKGLSVKEGSNAKMGQSVLVGGTVTVSTTAVTTSSRIFLTTAIAGGVLGVLSVGTITNATSFVINSTSAADTSTVNWMIVEPA